MGLGSGVGVRVGVRVRVAVRVGSGVRSGLEASACTGLLEEREEPRDLHEPAQG